MVPGRHDGRSVRVQFPVILASHQYPQSRDWTRSSLWGLRIWLRGMAPRIAGIMNPVPVASQQEPEMEPEPEALQRSTLLGTWPFE